MKMCDNPKLTYNQEIIGKWSPGEWMAGGILSRYGALMLSFIKCGLWSSSRSDRGRKMFTFKERHSFSLSGQSVAPLCLF